MLTQKKGLIKNFNRMNHFIINYSKISSKKTYIHFRHKFLCQDSAEERIMNGNSTLHLKTKKSQIEFLGKCYIKKLNH